MHADANGTNAASEVPANQTVGKETSPKRIITLKIPNWRLIKMQEASQAAETAAMSMSESSPEVIARDAKAVIEGNSNEETHSLEHNLFQPVTEPATTEDPTATTSTIPPPSAKPKNDFLRANYLLTTPSESSRGGTPRLSARRVPSGIIFTPGGGPVPEELKGVQGEEKQEKPTPSRFTTKKNLKRAAQRSASTFHHQQARLSSRPRGLLTEISEMEREDGYPIRKALSEALPEHFDEKYGIIKEESDLLKWFGDTRVFTEQEWRYLYVPGNAEKPLKLLWEGLTAAEKDVMLGKRRVD